MKRLLAFIAAALLSLAAVGQVSVTSTKTGQSPYQGTFTWATKPASAAAGTLAYFSDVGENGSLFMYSTAATRWRASSGLATLKTLSAAQTGIATTETIVLQALIPAGAWQTGDVLRVWVTLNKNGATDAGSVTGRIGTAGTTADTVVVGLSSLAVLGTANLSGGFIFDIRLVSSTSALHTGTGGGTSGYLAGGNSAEATATTITDASTNALFLSIGIKSNGATNTVGISSGSIQLITP